METTARPALNTAIWKEKNMQVPIELHNKRLVCKTVKRHFDSAEVVFFFHLFAFPYLGHQGRYWKEGRREKDRKRLGSGGVDSVCVFVLEAVERFSFSHWLVETVRRWSKVMGGEERGSSPRENLAASGSYTSLFISSYLKNFHIKHNEQKMLCWAFWPPFKGEDSLVGGVDKAGEAGWLRFGVDTFVCVCKKKRGERTESLGRSRVWGGKRGGVGTSHVEGRRECQLSNTSSVTDSVEGKTIPCWTPLIKNTIAHAIMQKTHIRTRHLLSFLRLH